MRWALIGSLLVHAAAGAAAWAVFRPGPAADTPGAPAITYVLGEHLPPAEAEPPPPELAAPPLPAETVTVADPKPQEPDVRVDAPAPTEEVLPPFTIRPVTALARPLPTREPAPATPVARKAAPHSSKKRAKRPGKTTPPRLVAARSVRARYPARARRLGLEGRTMLLITVSRRGAVEHVEVVESSGHTVLDDAARAAARQWVFEPARRDGKPVRYRIRAPVDFALKS